MLVERGSAGRAGLHVHFALRSLGHRLRGRAFAAWLRSLLTGLQFTRAPAAHVGCCVPKWA
eukprot:7551424-Alexandrium_andersonii.AAC.1